MPSLSTDTTHTLATRTIQVPVALLALVSTLLGLLFTRMARRRFAMPPGPKPLPIIGNYFDMPTHEQWKTYKQWSEHYDSDLVHVNVLGTDVIIVNTVTAADELFRRRSALYSSRPKMPMIRDLIGLKWHLAFMPHQETWRANRKIVGQEQSPQHTINTRPQQLKWTRTYLQNLMNSPDNFFEHIQHLASAVVLEDVYGLQVKPSGTPDPFIRAATGAVEAMGAAGIYGTYLVDYLPILKYVPSWFPGAEFQSAAKKWRESTDVAASVPFKLVKEAMAEGDAALSITSKLLAKLSAGDVAGETLIRHTGATMFSQGSAASVSALRTFFLIMVLHPEIQAKAQAEIDSIVRGRLPTFADMDALPYVSALIKEVLRWAPIVPLAFPRQLEADDMYDGYFLPAGSVIVPNTWAILQDPTTYRNPTVFDPTRFLTREGTLDPSKNVDPAFGYGRRVCPGRSAAMSMMYISIATTLAAFNVTKAVDEDGFHIKPSCEYTAGLLRYAKPFKCEIELRSAEAEMMIHAMND
ncbi:cytochrome P450 [Pterulicium gracile]|uniref:Cytochrome P450 n=1 Tax=Pterulicium gracile TaxID=1884261 RepID=A0A5C3R1U9_9AGAR|nr:cytochrome P450 [Pterula gracilis]